jgi:hypothetical protein
MAIIRSLIFNHYKTVFEKPLTPLCGDFFAPLTLHRGKWLHKQEGAGFTLVLVD